MPLIVRTVAELRTQIAEWRAQGQRIGFVPTMGALHAGHVSLVDLARQHADRVVVSLFVNPKQFGPNEDFDRYPRTEAADCALLDANGKAALVYVPSVEEMYPAPFLTRMHVDHISEGLCAATRPGHFDGVGVVVAKLLLQCQADVAVFGEKDYQQLTIIRQLVRDLNIPTEIIGAPIIREADGLALSSRNRYLNAEERTIAPLIYKTLVQTAEAIRQKNKEMPELLGVAKQQLLAGGFRLVDYVEVRHSQTLAPLTVATSPMRLLVAAILGNCRLIDNIEV